MEVGCPADEGELWISRCTAKDLTSMYKRKDMSCTFTVGLAELELTRYLFRPRLN
jgi:hypothetical protein